MNRRQFLLGTGLALAGATLPGLARALGHSRQEEDRVSDRNEEAPSLVRPRLQIIGIGGAGAKVVLAQAKAPISEVSYAIVDTSCPYALRSGSIPGLRIDALPVRTPWGQPIRERLGLIHQQGLRNLNWIRERIREADETLIVVGVGGATGSAMAPLFMDAVVENGQRPSLVAMVPFPFEGARRGLGLELVQGWQQGYGARQIDVIHGADVLRRLPARETTLLEAFVQFDEEAAACIYHRVGTIA